MKNYKGVICFWWKAESDPPGWYAIRYRRTSTGHLEPADDSNMPSFLVEVDAFDQDEHRRLRVTLERKYRACTVTNGEDPGL